jgi:hypothetical protein
VPTADEILTLLDREKVNRERTNVNGVNGIKFTDKTTGNSIFLPDAGALSYSDGWGAGGAFLYWSSMPDISPMAYCLREERLGSSDFRCGMPVRSVAE